MAGKKSILILSIAIIALAVMSAGCGPSEKSLQEAMAKTQTAAPTNTPTQTPAPTLTPTPQPVAVPLVYPGWKDRSFARVCVDGQTVFMAVQLVPGLTDVDIAARILPAATDLLKTMGMEVVPVSGPCEAQFTFFGSVDAVMKTEYHANGDVCMAYSEASLMGDFVFMAPPGGDGFNFPLNTKYKVPELTWFCNQNKEPPFDSVWPRSVVEAFNKVYGETALQAALKVPVLKPYAEEMLK